MNEESLAHSKKAYQELSEKPEALSRLKRTA